MLQLKTTSRDAYNRLLEALHQGGTLKDQEDKQDETARREDYPDVQFWTKRDWLDCSAEQDNAMVLDNSLRCGKTCASQGFNVTMRYVEEQDGTVVNGHRVTEMRRYARLIWVHMAKEGGPPPSWGKADVKLSQAYCREMRQRFPELKLCDLDWKADQIATDNYPSWYKNWLEHSQKVGMKQEQEEEHTLSDTGVALNQKRPHMQPPKHAAKKPKVDAHPRLANMEVEMSNFQVSTPIHILITCNRSLV